MVSVRGVSRQRWRTLIGGVPISSVCRAGTSVSSVDPELLGTVEVVRGPVSSAYGSGALGGVILANLRFFDGPFVARTWGSVDLLLLASEGADIGKPSTDFPERVTVYPEERHFLFRLGLDAPKGWRMETFAHSNSLETLTKQSSGTEAEVHTESLDLGFTFQTLRDAQEPEGCPRPGPISGSPAGLAAVADSENEGGCVRARIQRKRESTR